MASHSGFWIVAFFYLLATKLSDAHVPPAKPTPAQPPAATPQSEPQTGMVVEDVKEEARFLDAEKQCWLKIFGNLQLPPSINNSISFPPPPVLLAGAIAMSNRVHAKRTASYEDPEIRADILKALEVPVVNGQVKIDPHVEAQIESNLKAIIYDTESGDVDPQLDAKVQRFVKFLASGSVTGGGPNIDLSSRMTPQEMALFKEQMAIILGGQLPGQDLGPTDALDDDIGFTRVPPVSSILPIAKCGGAPFLDIEIHDQSVESLYFKARNLSPGQKFNLHFTNSKNRAAFMSSAMLDKSGMMSSFVLMDMISLLAESTTGVKQQATLIPEMDTISLCSQPATKGKNKDKCCATDVETMLNYTMAKLGHNLRSASLWIESGSVTNQQEYTITKLHKLQAVNIVGCTKMAFSIAVFYCQHLPKTVFYTVSLLGADGTKLRAPILCHEDTTMWNPNSWIFKTLDCQPEPSTKICHFLAADDIAWMPKTQENAAD